MTLLKDMKSCVSTAGQLLSLNCDFCDSMICMMKFIVFCASEMRNDKLIDAPSNGR